MSNGNKLIKKRDNQTVELMALQIANEAPELKYLTIEQLEQIAKIVITQNLTNELNLQSKIANINYNLERDIYLKIAGRTGSEHTQLSHLKSITILEKYCKKNNINLLLIAPGQIDDFIVDLLYKIK